MSTVRILHLEDSALDAELIHAELARNGMDVEFTRVDNEDDFRSAVENGDYDLILADYMVPLFGGLAALEHVGQVSPDVPFIFLSGMLGEDLAIETLKQGATDYVLKSRLERLTPAIRRALREAEERRQRRRAEQALLENEERLRLAVDSTRLGLWDFNPQTEAVQWCDRCRDMFGVPPGTPVTLREFLANVHPQDRAAVLASGRRALSPRGSGEFAAEFRISRRRDRAERWLATRGRAHFDAAGNATRFIGTTRDITEPRQAVLRVQKQAQQLRALAEAATRLNSARDLRSTLDLLTSEARQIVGARQAYATLAEAAGQPPIHSLSFDPSGAPHDRLDGSAFLDRLANSLCRDPLRACRFSQAELEADAIGRQLVSHWGDRPPIRGWLAVPLVARDGSRQGLVQLSDRGEGDFSEDDEAILVQLARMASVALENARLYDELRDNDRRKDEFLAMLAHELRNPLSAITAAAELLSTHAEPAEVAASASIVSRQCRHLTRLIEDLLDVARITRGKITLRRQLVDLGQIVRAAVEVVRPGADQKSQTLLLGRGAAAQIDGDPTRLEQIVVNLLTNAVKYTDHGGRIEVLQTVDQDWATLTVRDNGVGIPPDMISTIFDLFAQVGRSLDRSQGGLGIGLTIVQRLVALHGGSIVVRSEGPGRGSEFEVRLPLAVGAAPASTPAPAARRPTRPLRVLVVDDNQDSARSMALLLRKVGHEVELAFDGCDGLRQAEAQRPDIVLLDIGLPALSGFEVAQRIRQRSDLAGMGLVAVSGYGLDGDRQQAREAGFDAHLLKPVAFDELLQLLASLAERIPRPER